MKYKIYGYEEFTNSNKCKDENGKNHKIDFIIGGCLPIGTHAKDLIGKTVKAQSVFPYVEIAEVVTIVEE